VTSKHNLTNIALLSSNIVHLNQMQQISTSYILLSMMDNALRVHLAQPTHSDLSTMTLLQLCRYAIKLHQSSLTNNDVVDMKSRVTFEQNYPTMKIF